MDQLESRTLLSFSAHVNFAPVSAANYHHGYVEDSGGLYKHRGSLTYGWNHEYFSQTRNRDSNYSPDQRYDTLIQMRSGAKWEMSVPNGTYKVHVVAGDPSYWDSRYRINVEGQAAIIKTPSRNDRFTENTISVRVTDGRLTVTNGSGARNNKLDFIDIAQVSGSSNRSSSSDPHIAPAKPSHLIAAGITSSQVKLVWTDNSGRESGFRIERSTDAHHWSFVTNVGHNTHTYIDSGRSAGKTYYYRVRAYNQYGSSSFTAIDSAKTKSAPGSTGSSTHVSPAKPSDLMASGISTSQVKLVWTDNSGRESGFRIERSTDKHNWSYVRNVGANTHTYTDGGRSSGRTYYYRVRAYNSYGSSSYTAIDSAKTKSSNSSAPKPPTSSGGGSFVNGVHMSLGDTPSKVIPILRDLGIKAVRLINGLTAWSNRWSNNPVFQKAIQYHNAGFHVTLLTQCNTAATYSQSKAFFQWALKVPGLKSAVDGWEIQNEVDLSKYYSKAGNWSYYVNNDLKGAWDALHPAGEKVLGGSVFQIDPAKGMHNAGVERYCDEVVFHMYAHDPGVLQDRTSELKRIFGSKPIALTEWNFRPGNDSDWGRYLRGAENFIKSNFREAYYYRWSVNSSLTGHGGLVYSNYSRHNPFYDALKSWKY